MFILSYSYNHHILERRFRCRFRKWGAWGSFWFLCKWKCWWWFADKASQSDTQNG